MYIDEFDVEFSDDRKRLNYCTNKDIEGEYIIPNRVETIGKKAFADCVSMTKVYIPESVKQIESEAFSICKKLIRVECNAICPPQCGNHVFDTIVKNATLYVPSGCIEEYRKARVWKQFRNILSLVSISSRTFSETIDAPEKNETEISAPQVEEAYIPQNFGDDPRLSLTINQFSASIQPLYPNNRRLLSYFDNGTSPISQVLGLSENQLKKTRNIGLAALKAWKDWCDQIRQELGLKPKPIQTTLDKIRARICAEMPIDALFKKYPKLYQKQYGKRLSDIFKEKGPSTILDLFLLQGVKKQKTKKYLLDLQAYILEHLDDLDVAYSLYSYDKTPHALPELSSRHEYSLNEKVEYAIRQLCANWLDRSKSERDIRDVGIVQSYLLDNVPLEELASHVGLTKTRIEGIVNSFVEQFKDGVNSKLVENYYISQDLIDEITQCEEDCRYHNAAYVCDRIGIESIEALKKKEQLMHDIFKLELAYPYDKTACWNEDTIFCLPLDDNKKVFKNNVLQPIYKYLQKQYKPASSAEILQHLIESEYKHECLDDIALFETILQNYNKIEIIEKDNQQLYQLPISEINKESQTNRCRYLNGEIVNSPEQKSDKKPLYLYVYEYVTQNEIVDLRLLDSKRKEDGYSGSSLSTVKEFVRQFCLCDINNSNIYCLETAIESHPDHQWRQRRDGSAQNEVLQKIYEIVELHNVPVRASVISNEIKPIIDEWGYGAGMYNTVLRKYSTLVDAQEKDSVLISDKPFLSKKIKIERQSRGNNKDYLISLNPSYNRANLKYAGYRGDMLFREAVIARVLDALQSAPDHTLERKALTLACKSLFENSDKTGKNIIHYILYHFLPANRVERIDEEDKVYFKLINLTDDEEQNYQIEQQIDKQGNSQSVFVAEPSVTTTIQILDEDDIEQDREKLKGRLHRFLASYQTQWLLGNMDETIDEFVDYLWDDADDQEKSLRNLWYELLCYPVKKYRLVNIVQSSSINFEGYLRRVYRKLHGKLIDGTTGLGNTVGRVECFNYWMRTAQGNLRDIYEDIYGERNDRGHSRDLYNTEPQMLLEVVSNILVLYVYAYRIIERNETYNSLHADAPRKGMRVQLRRDSFGNVVFGNSKTQYTKFKYVPDSELRMHTYVIYDVKDNEDYRTKDLYPYFIEVAES